MAQQPQSPTANFDYVGRPEISEVFADSLHSILFDGSSLRLEFVVARFDQRRSAKATAGQKVTSCRLVLSPNGVMELYNKLHNMMGALEKKGVIKRGPVITEAQKPK
jgi:hypothetical protein